MPFEFGPWAGGGGGETLPAPPTPPTAVITGDAAVNTGGSATLDGTSSYDPNSDPLTYSWRYISASPAASAPSLGPTDQSTLNATFPAVSQRTVFTFGLVVNDGTSSSVEALHDVAVIEPPAAPNAAPVAVVTGPAAVDSGGGAVLDGSTSFDPDAGDSITGYTWRFIDASPSGPTPVLGALDQSTLSVTAPTVTQRTTLRFGLIVTDGAANSAETIVSMAVIEPDPNVAPVALITGPAGADSAATGVVLDGTGSTDADVSDTLSYTWRFIDATPSGTSPTLGATNLSTLTFDLPTVGDRVTYRFGLIVNDGSADSVEAVHSIMAIPAGGAPLPAGYLGSEATYAAALAALAAGADGDQVHLIPASGRVCLFERVASGDNFTRFVDVSQLTSVTPLGTGLVVEDGAIDTVSSGLHVTYALLSFPMMGQYAWADLRSITAYARGIWRGDQIDFDTGAMVGWYSPSQDYFVGGGVAGRGVSQYCPISYVVGSVAGGFTWTVNTSVLISTGGETPQDLPVDLFCDQAIMVNDLHVYAGADWGLTGTGVSGYAKRHHLGITPPAGVLTATDLRPAILFRRGGTNIEFEVQNIEVIRR